MISRDPSTRSSMFQSRGCSILTDLTTIKEERKEILDLRKKWNDLKTVDDRKGFFLDRFVQKAGIISHICREVGISRQRYYQWREEDPEFVKNVEIIKEDLNDYVESQLFKLISEGVPSAIIFHVKCKMKDRGYVERMEHDVRGTLFENINVKVEFIERGNGDKRDQD